MMSTGVANADGNTHGSGWLKSLDLDLALNPV